MSIEDNLKSKVRYFRTTSLNSVFNRINNLSDNEKISNFSPLARNLVLDISSIIDKYPRDIDLSKKYSNIGYRKFNGINLKELNLSYSRKINFNFPLTVVYRAVELELDEDNNFIFPRFKILHDELKEQDPLGFYVGFDSHLNYYYYIIIKDIKFSQNRHKILFEKLYPNENLLSYFNLNKDSQYWSDLDFLENPKTKLPILDVISSELINQTIIWHTPPNANVGTELIPEWIDGYFECSCSFDFNLNYVNKLFIDTFPLVDSAVNIPVNFHSKDSYEKVLNELENLKILYPYELNPKTSYNVDYSKLVDYFLKNQMNKLENDDYVLYNILIGVYPVLSSHYQIFLDQNLFSLRPLIYEGGRWSTIHFGDSVSYSNFSTLISKLKSKDVKVSKGCIIPFLVGFFDFFEQKIIDSNKSQSNIELELLKLRSKNTDIFYTCSSISNRSFFKFNEFHVHSFDNLNYYSVSNLKYYDYLLNHNEFIKVENLQEENQEKYEKYQELLLELKKLIRDYILEGYEVLKYEENTILDLENEKFLYLDYKISNGEKILNFYLALDLKYRIIKDFKEEIEGDLIKFNIDFENIDNCFYKEEKEEKQKEDIEKSIDKVYVEDEILLDLDMFLPVFSIKKDKKENWIDTLNK